MKKFFQFALSLLVCLVLTQNAEAGVLDWIGTKSTTVTALSQGIEKLSFDQLYRNVREADVEDTSSSRTLSNSTIASVAVPVIQKAKPVVKKTYIVEVSGYSSTPDQTDDSPFITASNTYVRDGIVAANFLPFGTRIKIPSLYGDKVFVVEDRMNKRYWYNVDIWFPDRQPALQLGRRTVTIEVL